ncbi:hypothetical protein WMY93_021955 [Mugilogobius chulae]|uniref:HAT C-terminal dimerisation domain-containing protein n=1 Tax=Mugilogobius chulae TaxID=88201 RepID=A0AAW0NDC4_9GOBI
MLPLEERNAVYDQARRIARDFNSPTPSPSASPSVKDHAPQPDANEVDESGAKRKRNEFSEWEDESDEVEERDEIQRYVECQFFWDGEDILSFWQSQVQTFPKLAKVAKTILCIPASSASSERTFSSAGRVLESRRNKLNPGTVDAILFLHSAKVNTQ